jgi:flagellar hook-associated protein 3 FlgL
MNVRVTGQTQVDTAIANMRLRASEAARYQAQLTSGVKVAAASDDPAAFVVITQSRGFSRLAATYRETVGDATSDLNAGVSALQESGRILAKAKTLAQQGASSALGPAEYEALATEVDSLLDQMIDTANLTNDGRYLFGGTADDTPPFRVAAVGPDGKPATIAYDGAAERASGRVGSYQSVDTRYVGGDTFQATGADAFASLIALRDDLRNTTLTPTQKADAVSARVGDLEAARTRLGEVMGEQSAALAGLEAIGSRLADLKLNADVRTGELESADYAEAVVRMREEETAFEATLGVSARLLQPSLLDFIR